MRGEIILILLILQVYSEISPSKHEQMVTIVKEISMQVEDWVGYKEDVMQVAEMCKFSKLQQQLIQFYEQLIKAGQDFSRSHIDVIRKVFKEKEHIKQFFGCMVRKRNTDNQYFKQSKRYKYLSQFIRQHPEYAQRVFQSDDNPIDKGFKLGRMFRAFFQFYYLNILNPSETISTQLIRIMTVHSDVFSHQDISSCLALDTSGTISQNLQGLDIKNIYIKIPQAFNAFKYLKLKDSCRTEKYLEMVKELNKRVKNLDMFKIMYHDYTPYVEIAAQKYGSKQVQRIAKQFAKVIQNYKHFEKLSEEQL